MVSCTASPTLVRTWFSWVRGSVLLRLIGLPAALLTLYLEIYGSSPATASLILHRLRRRLRLSSFVCTLTKGHDMTSNSISYFGGADSMDRAQTQSLNGKGASSSKPSDSDASTSTSTTLSHPSPTMPTHSRSKTASHVDVVGQGKRLSLQFPIQPAAGSNSPLSSESRSRPQSWVGAPSPLLSPDATSSPSETSILGVLAAQERYVLELREELNKAEADLKTLKKHYALHEANKRRNDVRRVAQLHPVNTSLANIPADRTDEDGSNLWMQREMERRKALLSNTKTSQRKVFSGSRHLRTLSLLSPDKPYAPSFPQPLDLENEDSTDKQPTLPPRSSTSSDITKRVLDAVDSDQYDLGGIPNMQRENIIRAGTQMAADFKNGLFTFIEDIRQATVGDEAVNGADGVPTSVNARATSTKPDRKASGGRPPLNRSASSKKSTQRTGSIADDFWKENGLSEPKSTAINKKTHTIKNVQTPQKQLRTPTDEDEDWDNWDTPNDADAYVAKTTDSHNSSDESEPTSPASGPGSSRTSTRYHSKRHDSKASSLTTTSSAGHPDEATSRDLKRNSIPWPDLVKLSPNNLKRTASHLMKEWEKQLTPPPESRISGHAHGDYLGRSSSPPA
ncbi:uncharacterized protein K460DRAFT_364013 [Cucurbitaria berberidis CBS 394.84]|uniref:DUF4048 domain-containing protein n=1 Tax=Cucurbitaria berberidis CBS 394.84 TaxID=1168544 RepID=A0A9P4GN06_9PLEO|nr:uncharacterized protein K460DRAFT_364013 [Cucurbitaria berberidis CBS 394.84]KAF1848005.1 hypothetical protein K460DRAFT_364013 [Cucurbitaria berberidis CBS 394.84]